MVFNLVEAAQEFLSEIVPVVQLHNQVLSAAGDSASHMPSTDVAESPIFANSSKDMLVYGFMDLFSSYEKSWNWSFGTGEGDEMNSSMPSHGLSRSKQAYEGVEKNFKQKDMKEDSRLAKLETVKEESEDDDKILSTTDSSTSLSEDLVRSSSDSEQSNKNSLGTRVEAILLQAADVEEVERRVQNYEQDKNEFDPNEDAHFIPLITNLERWGPLDHWEAAESKS